MEAKVPPPPKFDLAASNFPPLPGSGVSILGEIVSEMRLSDVVRGLKVPNKVNTYIYSPLIKVTVVQMLII